MKLERRMLYARQLFLPDGELVQTFRALHAAASVDTLFMLGQQELAKAAAPTEPSAPKPDRMARLASHMLQQRHLLPLFPTPTDERQRGDVVAEYESIVVPFVV